TALDRILREIEDGKNRLLSLGSRLRYKVVHQFMDFLVVFVVIYFAGDGASYTKVFAYTLKQFLIDGLPHRLQRPNAFPDRRPYCQILLFFCEMRAFWVRAAKNFIP